MWPVFEYVIKKLGGGGTCPPWKFLEICIANGAFWINLNYQLRAEISPIVSNIFHSSPATYFIENVLDCVCIDTETRVGGPKKGDPDP